MTPYLDQPSNQATNMSTFQSGAVLKSVFGDALERYTSGLLTAVCADYELNFEEVSSRYMDMNYFHLTNFLNAQKTQKEPKPRVPKEPKQEKKPCTGLTSKGGPCKFAALGDSDLCGIHQRKLEGGDPKPKVEKVPKEPKKPKQKKPDPKHSHPLTEEAQDCELCQSHGNVMDKKMPETKFEAVTEDEVSIKDRLKAILAASDDEEPEPEPEKTKPKPRDEAGPSEPDPKPKAKTSGFIRPKVKGKKVAAPVKKPEPEPEPTMDEAENIRSKLKAILANTEDDSEDEVDADDAKERLTHKLSEESEDCELCHTHGNVMDPKLTEAKFEAVTEGEVSIKDRLKAILAASDEEMEVEPEPVPEPVQEKSEDVAGPSEPRKAGFIRPRMKGRKKPEPEPVPVDEAESIRSKLKAILANTEDDSEDEFDADDAKERLALKLASKFEEDPDEMDIEQMCDTPDSQSQLRQCWADMTLEEEEEE